MLNFYVPGKPETAGSKKAFPIKRSTGNWGASVVDANPRTKGWQSHVAQVAYAAMGDELFDGPLSVQIVFLLPRPKSHYRSGKYSDHLKPNAPRAPETRPDVLKLARAVEDAMTGICYHDDSQITAEFIVKRYSDAAGCVVRISSDPAGDGDWVKSLLKSCD